MFEVQTETIAGKVTAVGSAGPFTLIGAPNGVVLTSQITPRQITLARQQLHAAIVHLTELLFADDI